MLSKGQYKHTSRETEADAELAPLLPTYTRGQRWRKAQPSHPGGQVSSRWENSHVRTLRKVPLAHYEPAKSPAGAPGRPLLILQSPAQASPPLRRRLSQKMPCKHSYSLFCVFLRVAQARGVEWVVCLPPLPLDPQDLRSVSYLSPGSRIQPSAWCTVDGQ